MDLHDDYRAALAIRHTPGIGPRTWKRLAQAYPSLTAAAQDAGAWSARGLVRQPQAEAFRQRRWRDAAGQEYDQARRHNLSFTVLGRGDYPARLAEIPDPPILFYYRGDVSLAASPGVAVVGTRNCSRYGLDMAWRFGAELSAAGLTVVSGLARGIDRQAHLAGLSGVGGSVAVLGTGLGRIYPECNQDVADRLAAEGLILSELPPESPPEARNFPVRNRIISGLSLATMVVEAPEDSGALITARYATEQGREVFAVPGPLDQPGSCGCHKLIASGACLAASATDILRHLADGLRQELRTQTRLPIVPQEAKAAPPPALPDDLTDMEVRLLSRLTAERTHIDVLGRAAELSSAEAGRTLVLLEVKGLVRQWPGMYYSRP